MKKLITSASAFAAAALPVLAQETENVADQVIEGSQNALEAVITAVGPAVVAVVVAGLGLWGAIAIVGLIKRAFNAGKGR